jgi:hypothetical protein
MTTKLEGIAPDGSWKIVVEAWSTSLIIYTALESRPEFILEEHEHGGTDCGIYPPDGTRQSRTRSPRLVRWLPPGFPLLQRHCPARPMFSETLQVRTVERGRSEALSSSSRPRGVLGAPDCREVPSAI